MKRIISAVVLTTIFILMTGSSCSQRGTSPSAFPPAPNIVPGTQAPDLTNPQDWNPPVYPGALLDHEIQASMTVVAATPEALDETAGNCFGFPVHDAIFYAYDSDAEVQAVMDFYAEQMAAQGWKRISIQPADSTLPHRAWQQGTTGPLVVYLMIAPMNGGRTLIYLTIAASDSPRIVIEE